MTRARQRANITRSITLPPEADPRPVLRLLMLVVGMSLSLLLALLLLPGDSQAAARASASLAPGAAPKTVHNTTGPKPPKNVRFKIKSVGGATGPLATFGGGVGETLIAGVPAYAWRDGCGPTAVGMVVGYYDAVWTGLVAGDALLASTSTYQMVASHSVAGEPRHYEDYSLPKETGGVTLADKSEAPAGDEHASDSVADFMHTSWSVEGMQYGWSWSNMIGPAFTGYVKLHYPSSTPSSTTYYMGSSLTWTVVKAEVDAGRPMVFLVDSSGDGQTDHFVTVIGYREINGYPEYACWDTWSTTVVRWQQFRAMSASYAWGVWGGFTLVLPGSPPDTTPPVTSVSGADDAWHSRNVTLTFGATDAGSGVAYTEYRLAGGAWVRGTTMTVLVPRKRPAVAVRTIEYRSADVAGNVEIARSAQVKIDTTMPVTTTSLDGSPHASPYTITLTATDDGSGAAATWYSVDGTGYAAGTAVTVTGAGGHTIDFYSVDRAGNTEAEKSAVFVVQ